MRIGYSRWLIFVLAILGVALLATACAGAASTPAKPAASAQEPTKSVAPTAEAAKPTAAPAPAAQVTSKLFIQADIVQGTKNLPQDQMAAKTCVVSSRFPRNAEILWRMNILDPRTGETMDDKAISSVQVKLADGKVVDGKYGKHGDVSFWTAVWQIPKDFPTGTLNYTIVATSKDGRTGEYQPLKVAPSLLQITNDVLADVAPATSAPKKQ